MAGLYQEQLLSLAYAMKNPLFWMQQHCNVLYSGLTDVLNSKAVDYA
jgi:hypothetical protein